MNERRFDGLFKEKLADFSQVPSKEAGRKFSKELHKRGRGAWIQFTRLAASLLLLAVCVYVVRSWNDNSWSESSSVTAQVETDPNENANSIREYSERIDQENQIRENSPTPEAISNPPLSKKETKAPRQTGPAAASQKQLLEEEKNQITYGSQTEPKQAAMNDPGELASNQMVEDQLEQPKTESKMDLATSNKPKVTITYIKSPAPPKPRLAMQEGPAEKSKGIKKLWRKISYNDFSLAGIRATKDQILAINKKNKGKESKSN